MFDVDLFGLDSYRFTFSLSMVEQVLRKSTNQIIITFIDMVVY